MPGPWGSQRVAELQLLDLVALLAAQLTCASFVQR